MQGFLTLLIKSQLLYCAGLRSAAVVDAYHFVRHCQCVATQQVSELSGVQFIDGFIRHHAVGVSVHERTAVHQQRVIVTDHAVERFGVRVIRCGRRRHQVLERWRGSTGSGDRRSGGRRRRSVASRRRLVTVQPGRPVHQEHRVHSQIASQVHDTLVHQANAHVFVGQPECLQRGHHRLQFHCVFVHEPTNKHTKLLTYSSNTN